MNVSEFAVSMKKHGISFSLQLGTDAPVLHVKCERLSTEAYIESGSMSFLWCVAWVARRFVFDVLVPC